MKRNKIKIGLFTASLLVFINIATIQVEANDTRNRVFNYTTMISTSTIGNRYVHPYETSTSIKNFDDYGQDIIANQNNLVTVNIQKNKIETSYITLNEYLPAQGTVQYIEGALFGWNFTSNLVNEEIDGINYTKGYNFSKNGLTPNTPYDSFTGGKPFQFITSGQVRRISGGSDNYFYRYYSKSLKSDIGINVVYGSEPRIARIVASFINGGTLSNLGQFYTPADDPSIIVSSVTTNTATISWSTNNTNPTNTSYTLQYRRLTGTDINNEAHWGSWTAIPVGGSNNTTAVAVTTSIFQPENTYQLRVRVNHVGGSSYDVYSDYVIFSTTADPAVRAAQEAAIAAQAAKKAAEDNVQHTLDTKVVAEDIKSDIRNLEYGLEAISKKIYNTTPHIQKIDSTDKKSITLSNEFEIKINAAGIQENLVYRVRCDSYDSGWTKDNIIKIKGLHETGMKTAIITVSNNPAAPEKGATVEDEFVFFKGGF